MNEQKFAGRVGIVTAAGAGIGRAIAHEWVLGGGLLVATDLQQAAADQVITEIETMGGEGLAVEMNVTDLDQIKAMVPRVMERFGRIDALFNVAGNNSMRAVEEAEDEEWQFIIDTNLMSIYRISKRVIPEMRKGGGGVIINIASAAGILAENRCSAYSASKAGVINLSRNMAMDFVDDNIRVNTISPGGTETPRIKGYMDQFPDHAKMLKDACLMGRMAQPSEIAKPAVFLASDDASFITGANLLVDGGMTAGKVFPLFDEIQG